MKNKLIGDIIENKPYYEQNSEYIHSIRLGIPIHIIDISILKKEIEELSITYKTILKLINEGIEIITELSNIMGIDETIIEETLSRMSMQNLIYPIGSNVKITQKGRETLKKMKLVKIKEDILKNISINSITNKLTLSNDKYSNVIKDRYKLKEKEDLTDERIMQRFDEINQIYKEEQKNIQIQYMDTKHYITDAISELHDIISINKNKVIYDCKKTFLYYKDETIICRIADMNSEEEEIYLNEIYNQYAMNPTILDVKFLNETNKASGYLVQENELESNKKILEIDIEEYKGRRNEELENKIMGEYYANRFLLDEEYISLLTNEIINFKGVIYIQMNDINPIIFNEEIFCALKHIGSKKQEIHIRTIKNNNNKKYSDRIKELRKCNVDIIETQEILNDIIMFENKFAILSYNRIYKVKDKYNSGVIKKIYTMYVNQDILDELKKSLTIKQRAKRVT